MNMAVQNDWENRYLSVCLSVHAWLRVCVLVDLGLPQFCP